DRSLVAGDRRPPQAAPVDAHTPRAHRVAGAGRLDRQHLGPEVAEQLTRERPRDEAPELEHAQARERAGGFLDRVHRGKIPTRTTTRRRSPMPSIGRYDHTYRVAVCDRDPPAGTRCEPLLLETPDRALAQGWLYSTGGED